MEETRSQSERASKLPLVFRLYKHVFSPLLHAISPSTCKYLPTCSEYAYTAVVRYGAARGTWMSVKRLLRCHPWAKGGLDPVPDYPCVSHRRRAD